jgi:hypothetical protein
MKMIIFQFFLLIISIVMGFLVGGDLSYSDLSPTISILQSLSASVFTLAGLWVAYIYPQAITAYKNSEDVTLIGGVDSTERIEELILIIIVSAFVLTSLLFMNLFWGSFKELSFIQGFYRETKQIGVSVFMYICFLQVTAVSTVMISNIRFINELHRVKRNFDAHKEL